MYIEDICIRFIGHPIPMDDYPDVFEIAAEKIEHPKTCAICGAPFLSKGRSKPRTIYHYCSLEKDPKDKHIYKIELRGKRYQCTGAQHHTMTPGKIKHKEPYTKEFKDHLVQYYLKEIDFSYSTISKYCSLTVPTVSKILKGFADTVTHNFIPHGDCNYYYLKSFCYQEENSCYLAKVCRDGTPIILGFFGEYDAKEELDSYLEFHWKHRGLNPSYTNETNFFATNFDDTFHPVIKKRVENSFVFYDQKAIDEKLEHYLSNFDGYNYFLLKDELRQFKDILLAGAPKESLNFWWERLSKEHQDYLQDLWDNILYYKLAYPSFTCDFKEFDKYIDYYDRSNLPFEMMSSRLMYMVHGDYLFTDEEAGNTVYDDENDILYRYPALSEHAQLTMWPESKDNEPEWGPDMFL